MEHPKDRLTLSSLRVYLKLLRFLRPYLGKLLVSCACMIVLAWATGMEAYLVGPVMTFLVQSGQDVSRQIFKALPFVQIPQLDRHTMLTVLPVLIMVVAVVKGLSYYGQFFYMGEVGLRVMTDLRNVLFSRLLVMSHAFFDRSSTGSLMSRVLNDVFYIEGSITYAFASLLRDSLQVIVLLCLAFYLDFYLAVVAVFALPLATIPIMKFGRAIKRVSTRTQENMAELSKSVHETLSGIRIVQAFSMETREKENFLKAHGSFFETILLSVRLRAVSSPVMELMGAAALAVTIIYAGRRIMSGALSPEHFISFFAVAIMLYRPVKGLGGVSNIILGGLAAAERVFSLVETESPVKEKAGAGVLSPFKREVRYEAVSFEYAAGTPVLSGVDLSVGKGELLAIVGSSGSGKTTLVNLLPRFYEAGDGRILVDGKDTREVTLASLRSMIGIVTQDTFLFNETVRYNIAYGKPGASEDEILGAARAANAHDFITALPKGYDTIIGERGVMLSGGQKQRISIARAILKDAPILILDEATSSLDSESEIEVQKGLDALMKNRTTLVIAHRLSTIRNAHRIIVIERGRIVEEGTHDELMARGGDYERLYRLQFSGQ